MKNLVLIRHGEAQHLVGDEDSRLTGGWTDSLLTDNGRDQAQSTGEALYCLLKAKVNFYSSDLMRCKETAAVIGQCISVQPKFTVGLRELNNGIAANRTRKEAKMYEIPITEPILDWTPYPQAESWGTMHDRVIGFMETIKNDDCETTVIVSHGGPITAIIHWWLEMPRNMFSRVSFEIETCSITRLTINGFGEKTIVKLNDTSHLYHG